MSGLSYSELLAQCRREGHLFRPATPPSTCDRCGVKKVFTKNGGTTYVYPREYLDLIRDGHRDYGLCSPERAQKIREEIDATIRKKDAL